MDNQADYEKAKAESWRAYSAEFGVQGSVPNIAFSRIFDYGYERGKAHADDHIPGATKKVADFGEEVNFPTRVMIAAMAMQGIITSEMYLKTLNNKVPEEGGGEGRLAKLAAVEARYFADALIAELEKEKE